MAINTNDMFKGSRIMYNNLHTYTHKNAKDRFTQMLTSLGISEVYISYVIDSNPISLDVLYFNDLALAILPGNIQGTTVDSENSNKTFVYSGQQFRIYNVLNQIEGENCQRIMHGDYIIGDYYVDRNLIIMYYNPFPNPPRIRKFQNALNLLFSNLRNLRTVDNSKNLTEAQIKKNYSYFSKTLKYQYAKLTENIQSASQEIESHGISIVNCEKKIQMNIASQEGIERLLENFDTVFSEKIDELKSLPFLNSVSVTSEGIKLDYGEISILYGKTNYYIGHIVVTLLYDRIKFRNLNNPSHGCPHPHVRESGEACFGSYQKDISRLLGQLEFKKLAILLRQMLNSYNNSSPIHNIRNWKSTVLPENAPVKPAKKTKSTNRNNLVSSNNIDNSNVLSVDVILASDNYNNGVGLSREEFARLNQSQRARYILNRGIRR